MFYNLRFWLTAWGMLPIMPCNLPVQIGRPQPLEALMVRSEFLLQPLSAHASLVESESASPVEAVAAYLQRCTAGTENGARPPGHCGQSS